MSETIIAKATLTRKVRDGFLVANVKLTHLSGNERPYFSVTGELWDSEGWYRNGQDGRLRECGQLVERIAAAFPRLAPLLALHLSDDTGAPMHDDANGWYWYERDAETCAKHLRVAVEDLPIDADREAFREFVEAQRDRWQVEADAGLALIRSL